MNAQSSHDEQLFADALALPPAERGAFLAKACGANIDQLAHLVALVAAHEGPESLMVPRGALRPVVSPHVSTIGFATAEENPGDAIGRYKLLQKIGEGGCGVVWMAEQEEPVRRRVALKVIKLGMDTKAVVARFEAERQALAMMDHPCIAKVHDAGSTDTGRPFFVMELVRGIPITKYCDENHLTPAARLELFIKVCQAIQHAHQKGVIHRDIKPSNILVTVNDGQPTPKVIDFGIAKATQGRLTDATVFTAFEQFIGTPVYMSPEQAEMSSLDIDTRSDIYSLGVLLYELLTGKPPFDPKAFTQAGVDQIRRQIREVEPPRPSARLRTLDADERTTIARLRGTAESQLSIALRGDLDWIVMRCIEKDRTRRYDTANGLAMDIQRYLRNEPVVARPPSTAYLLHKLIRRHRVAFAAAAAVLAVVIIGAFVSTWLAIRATHAERAQISLRETAQRAQSAEAALRRTAETQELAARRRAYAGDMHLIQQALERSNFGRAQDLLNRQRPSAGQVDLRGWEWRYFWQLCRNEAESILSQKNSGIIALSASADGQWLAVGEFRGGRASIWNARTREWFPVSAGNASVRVLFSPREPLIAVAGSEMPAAGAKRTGFVLLMNAVTRQVVNRISLGGECGGIQFSQDGQTLATITFAPESAIKLWRVADCQELRHFPVEPGLGHAAYAFATDPHLTVAAHHLSFPGNRIRIIDLVSGDEIWSAPVAKDVPAALAFSPDGRLLASGAAYAESTIRLWDTRSGREVGRLEGHQNWVSSVVFWPDGRTLASASADQTVRLWDVERRELKQTFRGHKLPVTRVAWLPNQTLVSGCLDGSIYMWDARRPPPLEPHTILRGVAGWAFAVPDGSSVLTGDLDGRILRRSGPDFAVIDHLIQTDKFLHYEVHFAPDCPLVAIGSKDGRLDVWNWDRRQFIRRIHTGDGPIIPVAFVANGSKLLAGNGDIDVMLRSLRAWKLANGEHVQTWVPPAGTETFCFAASRDGRTGLLATPQETGALLDLTTEQVTPFKLTPSFPGEVNFSADGKQIVVANHGGASLVLNTATLQSRATLTALMHTGLFTAVFSPDGTRIAAGGTEAEAIVLWDTASYERVLALPGEGSVIVDAQFSVDGNVLGAISTTGNLHLWRAPSFDEIEATEKADRLRER